jgi:hypothetical protein
MKTTTTCCSSTPFHQSPTRTSGHFNPILGSGAPSAQPPPQTVAHVSTSTLTCPLHLPLPQRNLLVHAKASIAGGPWKSLCFALILVAAAKPRHADSREPGKLLLIMTVAADTARRARGWSLVWERTGKGFEMSNLCGCGSAQRLE